MKKIICMFLFFAMAMSVMHVQASENAEVSFEFGDSDYKSIKTSVKTFEGDEEIHQTKITVQNKNGDDVDVYFANADTGATYDDVQSIINDEDDTDVVSYTIYEVVEPESEENGMTQEMDTYSTNSWDRSICRKYT